MRYLVTGGAGFIGSQLVNRLLTMKVGNVRAFDNETRGQFRSTLRPHLESIRGDVREPSDLRRAMQGCDGSSISPRRQR